MHIHVLLICGTVGIFATPRSGWWYGYGSLGREWNSQHSGPAMHAPSDQVRASRDIPVCDGNCLLKKLLRNKSSGTYTWYGT